MGNATIDKTLFYEINRTVLIVKRQQGMTIEALASFGTPLFLLTI